MKSTSLWGGATPKGLSVERIMLMLFTLLFRIKQTMWESCHPAVLSTQEFFSQDTQCVIFPS